MSEYIGRHAAPKGSAPKDAQYSARDDSMPFRPHRSASAHRRAARAIPSYDTSAIRPKRSLLGTILIIVILLIAIAGLVYGGSKLAGSFGFGAAAPAVEPGKEVTVYIPAGSTTREIGEILFNAGVITSQSDFVNVVKNRNVENALQSGQYLLTTGMANDDVIDRLLAGPPAQGTTLTIPEGLTIEQTAARVEQATGIPAATFIAEARAADHYTGYPFLIGAYDNSLEGFLFPKTYTIPVGATAPDVIRMMLNQFLLETSGLDLSWTTEHNLTFAEVVTTASMIEKETYQPDERPEVASVIYNRLRDNWRLQICATVVYVLGPDSRDFGAQPVNYTDLEVVSPYNTYTNDGLPPGPICSPSLESLRAACAPASTDYYYYVLTSTDGHHTFCRTDEEFAVANETYASLFGL